MMIEKLDNAVFSDNNLIFGGIDSDTVTFFISDIGVNSMNLNNVNLDDDIFDDYNPEAIDHIRIMAWYDKYKQHQPCKKRKMRN